MTTPTITIKSDEADRREVRIEMLNTSLLAEVYSVVFYKWNGAWEKSVAVRKDRANGKTSFSELNARVHHAQIRRVLDLVKQGGFCPA